MVTLAHHTNFTAGDLERFMGLSIGFDSMFNRMMNFPSTQQESGYPPYNIRKVDDYNYVIEIALAGFSESDIEVEVADGVISVRSLGERENKIWIHQIMFIEELRIALSPNLGLFPMTWLSREPSSRMVF